MSFRVLIGIALALVINVGDSTAASPSADQFAKCRREIASASKSLLKLSLKAIRKCDAVIAKNCNGTDCNTKVAKPCLSALNAFIAARDEVSQDTSSCDVVDNGALFSPGGLNFDDRRPTCQLLLLKSDIQSIDDVRRCLVQGYSRAVDRLSRTMDASSKLTLASFAAPLSARDSSRSSERALRPSFVSITKYISGIRPGTRPGFGSATRLCYRGGTFAAGLRCFGSSPGPTAAPTPVATPVPPLSFKAKQCVARAGSIGERFVNRGLKAVLGCGEALSPCEDLSADRRSRCLANAKKGCDQDLSDQKDDAAGLATTLGKKCGSVAFDELRRAMQFDALACECSLLGIDTLVTFDDYVACFQRQHECRVVEEARLTSPRLDDLLSEVGLGVDSYLCRSNSIAPAASRGVLRLRKFFNVKGATFGGATKYPPKVAGKPGVALARSSQIFGPIRKNFFNQGQSSSLHFRYKDQKSRDAVVRPPPKGLLLGVQQTDGSLVDDVVFDVDLDPSSDAVDVDVDYPGACAFRLVAATRDDAGVDQFVPLDQIANVCKGGVPNGFLDDGEECDDGNAANNDGCARTCTIELLTETEASPTPDVIPFTPFAISTETPTPTPTPTDSATVTPTTTLTPTDSATVTPTATPTTTIETLIDANGDGNGHPLTQASDVALDADGNVYVTGFSSNNAFKITPGGVITQLIDASGDGNGHALQNPQCVTVDGFGNVFVCGANSSNVFKITPEGAISQVLDVTGDGNGASLGGPEDLAVDDAGNLYVVAFASANVFKVTPQGGITQIIDSAGDHVGNGLSFPFSIAVDGDANVYVAGFESDNAFRIASNGTITKLIDASGDGAGHALDGAESIAVDASGNVYVPGEHSDNVFKITSAGAISQIIDASGDGAQHAFSTPSHVAVDQAGNVYVTTYGNDLFRVTPAGAVTRVSFGSPNGLVTDPAGDVYIAGGLANAVFRVHP